MFRSCATMRGVPGVVGLLLATACQAPLVTAQPVPAVQPVSTSQPAPVTSLSVVWEGSYSYDDPAAGRAVRFTFVATELNGNLSGQISEPNTFGTPEANFLRASVTGTIEGTLVRFRKQYDGSGGETHAVDYEGILDRATRTIHGQWGVARTTGTFKLRLTQ